MIKGFNDLNEEIIAIDEYNKDMLIGTEELLNKHIKIQQISPCVRELININQMRGVNIHNNIQYNFEFLGDHFTVLKILGNLISNAVRQIEQKGRGEILINTERNENYNILKIKDTAGGVSQELIDKIFELYKTGEVQGTGLGLSSAQMWMKKMKGKLEAHLVDNDCIEFHLLFPKICSLKISRE